MLKRIYECDQIKYGLEKEVFLIENKTKKPIVIPGDVPHDAEGVQVEFRGEPENTIEKAVASLSTEETRVKKYIKEKYRGLSLSKDPVIKIPRDIKLEARQTYEKGILKYKNIYGHLRHSVGHNESTAGIHLSITKVMKVLFTYNGFQYLERVYVPVDFVELFRKLDKEFREEIKKAKRKPGFYEFKQDGRVEYRSLPCNINMNKLISVVNSVDI